MDASPWVGDEKAFTLWKLLAVLLIIAVLAAIAASMLAGTAQVPARTVCLANVNTLQIGAELHHLDNGSYPREGTVDSSHPLATYTAGGVPAWQAGGVYVVKEGDGFILVECTVHGGQERIKAGRR